MKQYLIPALRLTLACTLFFAVLYPLALLGLAQFAANGGKGRLVSAQGHTYFAEIGQSFSSGRYFNSRPSAVGYNAAGSGGSNKGPGNPAYLAEVATRIDSFMVHNPGISKSQIPADLVTASGSGLDPHISVQAAQVQVPRIARLRGIPDQQLHDLVEAHAEAPLLGFLGTHKVNVLQLNLALDTLPSHSHE